MYERLNGIAANIDLCFLSICVRASGLGGNCTSKLLAPPYSHIKVKLVLETIFPFRS